MSILETQINSQEEISFIFSMKKSGSFLNVAIVEIHIRTDNNRFDLVIGHTEILV